MSKLLIVAHWKFLEQAAYVKSETLIFLTIKESLCARRFENNTSVQAFHS